MDTEKQLMEQLHQLQEENQALLNGSKQIKARNRELVKFIKGLLKDTFDQQIAHIDFEKTRIKTVNDALSNAYKTFSGQLHGFGEIAENLSEDKSPEVTRQVWSELKKFVTEQAKEVDKKSQQTTARSVKEANKQIKEAEKIYEELSKKYENINS
tara:strand:+ start:1789 stop:2253 length:465 start_codon:yes stop_codon:yes gene_type:complete